ncbi:MAG: amino acid permease [Acidobacteria bacterium]|nr:MAG: amino acid permease [Acidobacteriota bacterium]
MRIDPSSVLIRTDRWSMVAGVTFRRALGPFDATMVVIGGIIGAGIFISPYIVAQRLDTPLLVIGAWAMGGAIALAGAFSYAELGALFPKAGGQYVYLRDGLHPLVGFLYGWALLLVIESGAIAAVAITFATYALHMAGASDAARVPLAIAALVVLSVVNYLGVKPGSRVLNVLVLLKVAALAILIGAGFLVAAHSTWLQEVRAASAATPSTIVAFGAALVPILFAYGGWQNANYVAEEIEDPRRNLPLSLIAGTVAVIAIYVTANLVYIRTLGLTGLAGTATPAADVARRVFGAPGDLFVSAAIAISTFGFLNLSILAPTRVYYAMSADRVFVPALARLHPRFQTPGLAIIVQSTWSCLLALSGTYDRLLNYVVFADWIFFGLTVATVLVFRRTLPLDRRPPGTYRAPGYPIVPLLFCAISAAIVLSVVRADPVSAARGATLIALGIPVYYWYAAIQSKDSKQKAKESTEPL